MKRIPHSLVCAIAAAAMCATLAAAEEPAKPAPDAAAMAFPKPGPEVTLLQGEVGVWDATVEMAMAPGQPPQVSQGVRTCTSICNGLWIAEDFKSSMMGQPFQGHGVTGFDPAKGKYVGIWVDAMSTYVLSSEGTYDKAKGVLTFWMESPGPDGKPMKWHTESTSPDPDTRVWTAYMPGPDGKDVAGMKITYKRRKA